MKALVPFSLLILFMAGCAALPVPTPLDLAANPAALEACRRPFLTEKYRLLHALEIRLPDGSRATALGVLVANPATGRFRTVLMTLEGWVLSDIESGDPPTVHRGVPPLDTMGFARRLTEDIALAFFAPPGMPVAWEKGERGDILCRFPETAGRYTEVEVKVAGATEVRLYGTEAVLLKRVMIPSLSRPGLAAILEIRGEGFPSYGLRLRLLEAESLGDGGAAAPDAEGSPSAFHETGR